MPYSGLQGKDCNGELFYLLYRDILTKIEIHCGRQGEPTNFSWTALLYKLYKEVFPKSVHSPRIQVLYQLYMAEN